jgi:hypothetical protein
MAQFADQTGLSPVGQSPRRYLWTDAFAVCNFLELYRHTADGKFLSLALRLVEQVHTILGRHRQDDTRVGWISGLDDFEGRLHPTSGGIRIGKKLNERSSTDLFDENLEWDRDGQYYHYLTKWMHALNCVSMVTSDPTYNVWARELAKTIHSKFTFIPSPGDQKGLYWKMSIDLSHPLVPAMGHHDPLDGLITYCHLMASISGDLAASKEPDLNDEIIDLADICEGKSWVTDDSLGIGGLLCNSYQLAQMIANRHFTEQCDLLGSMLDASLFGLDSFNRMNTLTHPAEYRLAFRELGLSIGIHAIERLNSLIGPNRDLFENPETLQSHITELMNYKMLAETIENFWLEDSNRKAATWLEHGDINMVMLATSLAPDGFLQDYRSDG